jgi:uncharacterized cofD-like protein
MTTHSKNLKIVVIGGGTGSFTLLQALKKMTPEITALVNMADDGGSTGVLRDELGVLPPGDARQCLVALSEAPEELRELFNFRFGEGTFAGHSFGNLFLSAVEKMTDNFADAVRMASELLRITGSVVPITLDNCQLVLTQDGKEIAGEFAISEMKTVAAQPDLKLKPHGRLNPDAKNAIENADMVVIAPGNLYGSLAPALLTDGLRETLAKSSAKIAYTCNLVNKKYQTAGFAVHDYAAEIERFLGAEILDFVLYNSHEPTPEQLKKYALEGEFPVRIDPAKLALAHYRAVPGKFLSHDDIVRTKNDTRIERSLIRHDAGAVAGTLETIAKDVA